MREQGVEADVNIGAKFDDVALDEVDDGLHDVIIDQLGIPGAMMNSSPLTT